MSGSKKLKLIIIIPTALLSMGMIGIVKSWYMHEFYIAIPFTKHIYAKQVISLQQKVIATQIPKPTKLLVSQQPTQYSTEHQTVFIKPPQERVATPEAQKILPSVSSISDTLHENPLPTAISQTVTHSEQTVQQAITMVPGF